MKMVERRREEKVGRRKEETARKNEGWERMEMKG